MEDMISIIIPVYNAEKYLERCLESVLKQSYSRWEVILIDDGSSDKSPIICNKFAEKDTRFRVIHQVNQGICCARNVGLQIASGEWFTFLDHDDWLPKDALKILHKKITDLKADLICGNFSRVLISGSKQDRKESQTFVCSVQDADAMAQFLPLIYTPWAKLYRTSILKKNELLFSTDVNIIEDCYFVFRFIRYCSVVASIPDDVYYWSHINSSSESRHYHDNINYCYYKAYEQRLMIFKNETVLPLKEEMVYLHIFEAVCNYYINNLPKEDAVEKIKETAEIFSGRGIFQKINFEHITTSVEGTPYWSELVSLLLQKKYEKMYLLVASFHRPSLKEKIRLWLKKIVRSCLLPIEQFAVFRLKLFYK